MTASFHHYRAYGLHIASEMACPGFCPCPPAACDVEIRFGAVPDSPSGGPSQGPAHYLLEDGSFLLTTKWIACVHLVEGRRMTIAPHPQAPESAVRHLALGWGLGALFPQRGLLAFHGAALADEKEAILVCGPSHAGKSTTAQAMVGRGYRQLDDNLILVSTEGGEAFVPPGSTEVKLWQDALDRFGLPTPTGQPVKPQVEKWIVQNATPQDMGSRRLRAIVCLGQSDAVARPERQTLRGQRAFMALRRQLFCPSFAMELMAEKERMAILQCICRRATVHRVLRPAGEDSVDAVAEILVALFRSPGS